MLIYVGIQMFYWSLEGKQLISFLRLCNLYKRRGSLGVKQDFFLKLCNLCEREEIMDVLCIIFKDVNKGFLNKNNFF